ncbi:ribosomal RNA small subunit methyltransferase D [Mycobacteroides abscessus subsp. abscessus]|uniref:16S rRNA (guanine(966)-N(2))-methyltransferase RsmD n=1 Tax=Mycobacteroides abscessus TaxID=36809 RepID=UPI0005E218E8|nr:16S rRNA (guanine(966)-N(2))-methyltransferase RsmD [Mycobacteroides abscessus]SIN41649.1 RNA methyltransferase, RsmD family [Mycobacteroides abscessus subsp. abscessus]CPZ96051.1 ribosomal RNA small subunit methyltransferase D [Mycobacteroides abscessus]SKQ79899.1 ribosomal RNA small subunit methyltransferase D [Mycobacteroides abscessus subsp. abscessus]SKX43577.1 RNA methyltransferase, RsmD family [Mycobacteroides abscessus subsp. abscessus]SLF97575.1 ribosomal RNA small subunit methyltr
MPPKGTRPTTDRVREALFSMLEARLDFEGIAVLDLFAGSGALGLEALSRGAQHVTFVESNAAASRVISANIATVGLPGAVLRQCPVSTFLSMSPDRAYDLVLADPPYSVSAEEVSALLSRLTDHWVTDETLVVLERDASGPEAVWPDGWELISRKYGGTRLELGSL